MLNLGIFFRQPSIVLVGGFVEIVDDKLELVEEIIC